MTVSAGDSDASADTRPIVEVAVGVVFRPDGRVLFGQRVPGKPYAGWWEFPGGKLEKGETVEQALARELHEELGLDVHSSWPWVVREFSYPHARVRLHFQRVVGFRGEPQSREGQAFRWCDPQAIEVAPLLPATEPVLGWLKLPQVYGISQATELGVEPFLAALQRALDGGLRLVQLREKALPPAAFDALFVRTLAACRAAGALLLVNSDHPRRCWDAAEGGDVADGVHLTSAALAAAQARPAARVVAASAHDAESLARATALGLDFAVLGPVLPTASHPGEPGLGWPRFEALARGSGLPVFALGGLEATMLAQAQPAGAHGIAMIRGAWRA